MTDTQKLDTLRQWIKDCGRIVFFGGAGVSTESGIPDFRSVDGLYSQKFKYPPEYMLSHEFYEEHTAEFFEFYRAKMIFHGAQPNITHRYLARLEAEGKLSAIVTQNIDGLHQAAGSKTVYELHGSVLRNYCVRCHKFYGLEHIENSDGIPTCECGGIVKPDVVLYGEGLDGNTLHGAREAIMNADLLIVGGTSLAVYPAAGLIDWYNGSKLVLINKGDTAKSANADIVLRMGLGEVFDKITDN